MLEVMRAGGMVDEEIGMILSRVGMLSLYTPNYFVDEVPVAFRKRLRTFHLQ